MATIKGFFKKNKSFLIILIVMVAYYIQHLISFRLGMNYEESRDANAYLLAMQGYLPYRDFEWIYGPFSFFIYPQIMKIFGVNLIVLRISYITFASLVIPLTYFLAKRIMPFLWAGIAAFLSIIFFDVPYYTFNHVFAVLGELTCLLMTCRFIEADRKISNLFWAGIFAATTILTKHFLAGVSLFFAVSLFLLFVELGTLRKRFKNCLIFVLTCVSLVLMYFLYFYSQTKLKNIAIAHPYFGEDSILFINQLTLVNLGDRPLLFFRRFMDILPIAQMINISSFADFKKLLVDSFDNLIFILPFIAPVIIFLIYTTFKFNEARAELKQKIYWHKKYLLLFAFFSIFISLETLISAHRFIRSYIIQVPFILTAYILYLIKIHYSRRSTITGPFILLFLFCLSFLHFFRYPYSMLKKYTEHLNLSRAKGILVTHNEKKLYESLSSYLSVNFSKEDKMAVLSYHPQLSFLTEQKDIFAEDEFIFRKLEFLVTLPIKTEKTKSTIVSLEDWIISKMEREKPKVILIVTDGTSNILKSHPTLANYIEKKYSFDKTFGPADMFGLGGNRSWVKLYK